MSAQHGKTPRKRRPKPGDIASLRRVLWSAIRQVEELLELEDPEMTLKAVSALSTAAGVYLKCTEAHELVARLEALEAKASEWSQSRKWAA